jgi:elongation factor Ts
MPEITAAMVKQLRDETQVSMMECKKALQDSGGDFNVAKQKLREAGIKTMAARADRATGEGRIAISCGLDKPTAAIIELQCESAPVANNDEFVQLANDLAQQLASGPGAKSADDLWTQPSPSQKGKTLADQRDDLQNKIREVFRLARQERIEGSCGGYVHHDGKTGVLLRADGGKDDLAKDIAMQIVALRPQALNKEDLDPAVVAAEKSILMEAARKEGKPENILEKMVEGRMKNFFAEKVLTEQPFVKDDKQTVGALAKSGGMKLLKFHRWQLGETSASAS